MTNIQKNIKTKAILLLIATVIMPLKALSIDTYQDYALDTITGKNTMTYHVTAIYSDGTEEDITSLSDVTYSTSGLCTATNGTITGLNYGKVNIGFSYNGETDSLPLIIENVEAERTVSSIEFSPSSLNLQIGQNTSFTCSVIYKDGHQQDISSIGVFKTDNANVIKLLGDSVISVGKGTANIIVSYKGVYGSLVTGTLPVTVTYLNPFVKNEAENYTAQSGVQCETLTATDKNVAFIENNDWVEYEGMDFGDNGPSNFTITAATPNSGGYVRVYANDVLIATCPVTSSGGWSTWKAYGCKTNKVTGVNKIRLVFIGVSGYLFNINSWYFTEETSGISNINADTEDKSYYTTSGINAGTSAKALPKGIYIHSKRKVVISNNNR